MTGPAAPGSPEKQAAGRRGEGGGRDRTACFSCGEKVARYKRSRVGFRTGESATRFTRGPEESDFDVFLVSGLRNAQVLYAYLPTTGSSLLSPPFRRAPFLPATFFFFFVFFPLLPRPIESSRIRFDTDVATRDQKLRQSIHPDTLFLAPCTFYSPYIHIVHIYIYIIYFIRIYIYVYSSYIYNIF